MRHDLGEYYTPDWLAELVLDELGYDGNPDKRLLDPACGSGTFLVMALNRVKTWYDAHRHECGFGEGALLRKILHNVVGFDLNPLAVMAARTNYLLAVRELLRHAGAVELPVYLCDAIMTPSEYGDVFTGRSGNARRFKTSAGDFSIPTEVTESREHIGRYADTLEACIRDGYSPDEFIGRCEAEAIPATQIPLHKELYRHLQRLDADNENGIWARIIKNAFAPLFIGRVDYVAGNPPWVNWENLPEGYRDGMKPLWVRYGLFTLSGSAGRLGGGKKDISMLFTYSAVDNYLSEGGRLGFVITQSVFKTQGAGDGFRRFEYEVKGTKWHIPPLGVHDLSDFQPFDGANNSTAVLIVGKRMPAFSYPVPYTMWKKAVRGRIASELPLHEVRTATTRTKLVAQPVQDSIRTSPWLTVPKQVLSGIQKVIGASDYRAYAGCCTWLNGVYWVNVVETLSNGRLLIENLYDEGKLRVKHVQAVIEPDLVYPLLRGKDVRRWQAEPSAYIVLTQDPETRKGIPEAEMKRRWPKTYAYLKQFEGNAEKPEPGTLRGRSGYSKYFKPSHPFYSMYNVGPYTIEPIKVFWRQFIPRIEMTLCLPVDDPSLGRKVPLTQHVVTLCPFQSVEEAFFFSACGNSSPAVLLHSVSSTGKSFGRPLILRTIKIPRFDPKNSVHSKLTDLSRRCHAAKEHNRPEEIPGLEYEIDNAAARIWGITDAELKAIREALDKK